MIVAIWMTSFLALKHLDTNMDALHFSNEVLVAIFIYIYNKLLNSEIHHTNMDALYQKYDVSWYANDVMFISGKGTIWI